MTVKKTRVDRDAIVADVLERWPQAIPVFLRYGLACVGCSMAPFETLEDVVDNYKLKAEQFYDQVNQAVQAIDAGSK